MATASQKEVSDAIQAALVHAQVQMVVIAVKVMRSVLVLTTLTRVLANAPKVASSAPVVMDRVASISALVLTTMLVVKALPVLALMLAVKVSEVVTIAVKKGRTVALHPVSVRATTTPMLSTAPRSALSIRKNTSTPMLLSA